MISIIVCSIDAVKFQNLCLSISQTIGDVTYEIIKIDNAKEQISITKAYNRGAKQAKYAYFLFLHEDVLFCKKEWGNLVLTELKNKEVGVLGVAGSSYVPFAPIGYTNPTPEYNYYCLFQPVQNELKLYTKLPKKDTKIYAVDGVFLAICKENFELVLFDEDIPGFHGYDLAFSLKASYMFDNKILTLPIIEHYSGGKPNKTYWSNNILIRRKYTILMNPVDCYNEYSAFLTFLKAMKANGFSKKSFLINGLLAINLNVLGKKNFLKAYIHLLIGSFTRESSK